MRILFLSAYYLPHAKGGAELSTHYLAQALVARGHNVTVATAGDQAHEANFEGVTVKRLPVALTAKPLLEEAHAQKVARQVASVLPLSSFDLVHAHDFRTALVLSELRHPHKVVTVRDYAQICGSTNYLGADGGPCPGCTWTAVWRNHRVAEARGLRQAARAWQYVHNLPYRQHAFASIKNHIYISRAQRQLIEAIQPLPQATKTVIYNPVGAEYLNTPVTAPAARDLLYVGTVEWYKGVELLLNAFHQLAREFPEVQLTVVGDGADRSRFERLVAQWGLQYRVKFTGRVAWNALRPYYDAARIVVAPHIWVEPFGRTVAEAMARGRLVVAADSGGPGEIIQHQRTGLLFTPNSSESLTERLREALVLRDLDYRELTGTAHSWIRENLTPQQIAQHYEAQYARVH